MSDPSGKPGNRPKSINTLMRESNRNQGLGKILAHAARLNRIDRGLTAVIDPALSNHCQVADFNNHCLTLVCSNASFATRIRMISKQLLEAFNEEGGFGIERINICIAPVNRPQPEIRQPRKLPASAIKALGRFASDSGDAEIQAIFDRINSRRNRK